MHLHQRKARRKTIMMEDNSFRMRDGSRHHHSQPGQRPNGPTSGGYTGCPMWTMLLPSGDPNRAKSVYRQPNKLDYSRLRGHLIVQFGTNIGFYHLNSG